MMKLRDEILSQWSACRTEAERQAVFGEVASARREILIWYLAGYPELRLAVENLTAMLDGAALGVGTDSTVCQLFPAVTLDGTGSCGGRRVMPFAGAGAYVDAVLSAIGEMRAQAYAELCGEVVHAERRLAAARARKVEPPPPGAFTGWVAPPDPLTVKCHVCQAPPGEKCRQVKRGDDER